MENKLEIETWPMTKLRLDPNNARKHDAKNIDAIAKSLDRFGQRKPIVVVGDGTIVAGNGTVQAAKQLGWTEMVVARIPWRWTPDEIKAYALADNRTAELAEWDSTILADQLLELDAVGWDVSELGFEALQPPIDPEPEDDAPLEFPKEPVTKLGDIWQLGRHRLMCGDSTDEATVAKLMNGQKADMVLTDPPYGIGYEYNSHNDQSNEANAKLVADVFKLSPEVKVWTPGLQNLARDISRFGKSKVLVWNKKFAAAGNGLGGASIWEPILIVGKVKNPKLNVDVLEIMTDREITNEGSLRKLHPCPKPLELFRQLLMAFCDKDDIIYEPFCGSGTTLIACEQLKMQCLAIELDALYVDVIVKRWENLTGKTAELIRD